MKRDFGPVAQLVERCIRIAEVSGSNPLRSTTKIRLSGRIFVYLEFVLNFDMQGLKVSLVSCETGHIEFARQLRCGNPIRDLYPRSDGIKCSQMFFSC